MPPLVKRGRAIVASIIAFNLLLGLSVILLAVAKERHDQLPRLIIKFLCNIATLYGLWQGNRFIRGLFVFGFFAAAIFCVFIPPLVPMVIMLPIAMLLGFAGSHLAMGPAVKAFFAWQRGDEEVIDEWEESEDEMDTEQREN